MELKTERLPGDKPIATLKCDGILRCIQNKPERLDDKKWHELVVGYLLCQFFSEKEKPLMCVGFPLVHDWESLCSPEQLTICNVIENHSKLIEDRDIDVYVGFERLWQKCQITRYVIPTGAYKTLSLAQLIAKKCSRAQTDRSVMLIISIESQPHITEEELRDLAKNTKVPFGHIILIIKASEKRGHFEFCQMYPSVIYGEEIQIPLLV